MELLFTAETIGTEEALAIGLVSRVVPIGKLAAEVEKLAEKYTQQPRRPCPRQAIGPETFQPRPGLGQRQAAVAGLEPLQDLVGVEGVGVIESGLARSPEAWPLRPRESRHRGALVAGPDCRH